MNVNAQFKHVLLYEHSHYTMLRSAHESILLRLHVKTPLQKSREQKRTGQTPSLPDTITSTCLASRLVRALASRTWGPGFDPRACLSDSGDPDVIVLSDMTRCILAGFCAAVLKQFAVCDGAANWGEPCRGTPAC